MCKIEITWLDKSKKELILPALFDLYHSNMKNIAPSTLSYEQEREQWLNEVSMALDKEPRQIILCLHRDEIAGYFQYYIRGRLLMVEELQIRRCYQRTILFCTFCRHIASLLPLDIQYIEAYSDRRNKNSQILMEKLGMKLLPEENFLFLHFRGDAEKARNVFLHRT